MIPETLADWTLEMIEALLHQGIFESDRFDFKEKLPHKSDEKDKQRLVKACASFANSGGGFLIFGVKDNKGLTPSQRLIGLDPGEDFPERFGNFPSSADPSVEWTFRNPALRLQDGRLVHVAHIAPSPRRPHAVLDQDRWWFCKRTSKGTEAMSYHEVRDAFTDAARRRGELAWLAAEVERIHDLAKDLNAMASSQGWSLDMLLSRFEAGQVRTLLVTVFSDLDDGASLVTDLHSVIDRCMKVDTILAPAAAFAMRARDRSYSGDATGPTAVQGYLPGLVGDSGRLLKRLKERLK